ncbi:vitamin K epoxide reductase family protein [Roseomonas sp. SSH11]|uniref:Vitamin K epoxide reductase family protein n=1 Tax=Pararoseomonas baculiformis TaxID=2820812 RepID=A0ABS4AA10_9PROT|nr:vitamin K epoxide reductase family protein [Pararoseomonas baculiformis]MBP0443827.1 vitamin K epoxide reductase family protein [Pararoseomonas baculiformis]
MPSPSQLSRDLRLRSDPDLRRRRWLVGLSLFGVAIGQVVALYQTGILRRLPDPPVGPFDSERVNASDYAYKRLQVPDAFLMVATYAATAALAAAGGRNRAERRPLLPIALAAKTLFDVGTNLKLAREEWEENEALCAYCQTATLVSVLSVALALPEASRALRRWRRG